MLDALAGDFGAVTVLPVHPKPDAPAIRVIVRAIKANRAALMLLPGLILADADGRPTAEAGAVLRDGALLPLAGDNASPLIPAKAGSEPVGVGKSWVPAFAGTSGKKSPPQSNARGNRVVTPARVLWLGVEWEAEKRQR